MNFFKRYAIPLNLLVIAVTIVFVGAALVGLAFACVAAGSLQPRPSGREARCMP